MQEEMKKWIRQFRSGRIWLNKLQSEMTIRTYLPYFKRYCNLAGKNPDELIELKMEGMKAVGTLKEFQSEELHDDTIKNMVEGDSPKANMSTAVLSFYKHNRRPLTEVIRFVKPEGKKRRPTLDEIEIMANHAKTKRDKALIWFTSSFPVREKTLSLMVWGDLQSTGDPLAPIKIEIESRRLKGSGKGRYVGTKHIGFLHQFAWKLVQEYPPNSKLHR